MFVTHGYTDVFRRWLESEGYEAHIVSTEYGEDTEGERASSDLKRSLQTGKGSNSFLARI